MRYLLSVIFIGLLLSVAVYAEQGQVTKKKARQAEPTEQTTEKFDCSKKRCTEMSSCEEAMYKYKQCGHSRLDRDKDGVPCESICPGG